MPTKILTPKQVANSPEVFTHKFLKILDKKKSLIPFHWNRAQIDLHSSRTGRDLILKARQLGLSTYLQGEMFRRAVTSSRTTITMAHDNETTQKMREIADRFWTNCKFNGIQPQRHYANASITTYPEFDSSVTIGTAGASAKGRGGTYTDFHGSEVAFWPDAESIVAGAMQGGDPDVALESTPNGAQGYFYEKCMEAAHGDSVWKLHFYPWWWDAGYWRPVEDARGYRLTDEEKELSTKHNLSVMQIAWRREKKRELGRLFAQEYPEDPITCFLTSGNGYFGDLTDVFTAPMGMEYIEGHEYSAGLDFGQTNDYTAMPVFDKTTKSQVDILHERKLPWSEMRERIKGVYNKWHLNSVLAEKNSIGSVNIEELQKIGVNAIAFDTTNESKAAIMSNMNEAIHHGGWKLMDHPAQRHECNTFVAIQLPSGVWRLAAEGDGHDDIVMGDALGIFAATSLLDPSKLIDWI